jgi:hypothetical protein
VIKLLREKSICVLLLTISLGLTSCAASGPGYMQTVTGVAPPSDQAELIIYRTSGFMLAARAPKIEINGQPTCDLPQGGFFKQSVSPGTTTVSASLWDMPGTSRAGFNAEAGKRYAVRVSVDGGKMTSGVLGGFVGLALAEGMSGRGGPFQIDVMLEEAASAELAQARMTSCSGSTVAPPPRGSASGASSSAKMSIDEAALKCSSIGFKEKTEEFGKCVLQLTR